MIYVVVFGGVKEPVYSLNITGIRLVNDQRRKLSNVQRESQLQPGEWKFLWIRGIFINIIPNH